MKKSTYQIRKTSGELVDIEASEFAIFGYGIFIVHRDHVYPSTWTVSDPRTGYKGLGQFPTRKAAIEENTAYICKRYTPEELQALIRRSLDREKANDFLPTNYEKENYAEVQTG